ncbi:phospholipase C [Granulicella paludicola]|uniref:phospholipase C n=1 Tax=Granulicella paludicola TaxID=474951 RepID=UPI0021DFD546|nr:alkaline phosphatase family protein [Granulicella paludicola]
MFRKYCAATSLAALVLTGCGGTGVLSTPGTVTTPATAVAVAPSTAIKHVVVIYGENISFDHYFGTYPNAANTGGTTFTAAAGTTTPNNYISNPGLLTANPNLASSNGNSASNPFRLTPQQAATADQDHNYNPEQVAFDNGKMDMFPLSVGTADTAALATQTGSSSNASTTALTMGYYDGNTVSALWNYAQHYAMNDHSFGGTFGPSTPGALELAAGQTNGVTYTVPYANIASGVIPDGQGSYTDINDEDPAGDVCSSATANFSMTGKNVGDLMTAAGVTWGFFEGGFNLSTTNANGTTNCARTTAAVNIPGNPLKADYIPHHQPFQYWPSTANPLHNRPTAGVVVGANDATGANHEYDTADFNAALTASTPTMASVSFLKAPGYQDAHAGYSDPLDEQTFIVNEINLIQNSPFWQNTAIIIAYDDSDGWYDHLTDIVNGSTSSSDAAICNSTVAGSTAPAATFAGPNSNGNPVLGRCGKGPRLPLLVISPYAKKNYVDTTLTEQASITRFIEDIFLSSQRIGTGSFDSSAGSLMNMFNFTQTNGVAPNPNVVLLNPTTGAVTTGN